MDSSSTDWPAKLTGITESVVATRGPQDRWNFAALGLQAGDQVTARTWGDTRTRRNFERRGEGVVQFVEDPLTFARAALGIVERTDPVHPDAAASTRVHVHRLDDGVDAGTEWVEWALHPTESRIYDRTVPTINRGHGAVVEATVLASRLDVDAYDDAALTERLDWLAEIVGRCGGPREREAMETVIELSSWTPTERTDR